MSIQKTVKLVCTRLYKMREGYKEIKSLEGATPEVRGLAGIQLLAVETIINYVTDPQTTWCTDPEVRAIVRRVVEYGSGDKAAEFLGISRATVYRQLNKTDALLLHKIGETTLEKIEMGAVRQAMYEFSNTAGVDVPDLISLSARRLVAENVAQLPSGERYAPTEVDLRGCEKELQWLRMVNLTTMQSTLNDIDLAKVRHLLEVLQSEDTRHRAVRVIVQRYLDARDDTLFNTLKGLDDVLLFM